MRAIDAIKRLERSGEEYSRVTEKLKSAAATVANLIEHNVPEGIELPRGYKVVRRRFGQNNSCLYLDGPEGYVDCDSPYIGGDFHACADPTTRKCALQFAADVSSGLLEEISELLEKRAAEGAAAAEKLELAEIMDGFAKDGVGMARGRR